MTSTQRPTWARLDCNFRRNPKVMELVSRRDGWQALVMYLDSIAYTTEHLCDGFVPKNWPRLNGYPAALPRMLLRADLWHEVSDLYPEEAQDIQSGYIIHDFDKYQVTRSEWESVSERNSRNARKRWSKQRLRSVPSDPA